MTTEQASPRSRSRRAAANDEVLLGAAAHTLSQRGWDELAFTAVAKDAGLSTRPLYDRFGDRSRLGCALWDAGAGPELTERLALLLKLVLRPDTETPDIPAIEAALTPFIAPTGVLDTGIDLVAATLLDEALRQSVAASVLASLSDYPLPADGGSPQDAARAIYVVITALGLYLASRRPGVDEHDWSPLVAEFATALSRPAIPQPLPDDRADHMLVARVHTGDPSLDDLLSAALLVVGERGYQAATTGRIVAAAGVSEGMLYGRYPTKLDLFLDAASRALQEGFTLNLDMAADLAARYSPAISEAVFLREALRPEHSSARMLSLEQLRLSWHEPRMKAHTIEIEAGVLERVTAGTPPDKRAEAIAAVHWGLALGFGTYMTATLIPEAWTLPFDVVAVPLLDQA
ncbi:MAG: TetR/AcrR family transcriptional regulator [Actinobacteria bacterium]|nr:TetR/AcrR family transcriptional regulator [Actinomycetota bacterium]